MNYSVICTQTPMQHQFLQLFTVWLVGQLIGWVSPLGPCRRTTWSLTVRPSWRPNSRCRPRMRSSHPVNSWSSKLPASQPPRSTSSRPPPTAAAPARCTSANRNVRPVAGWSAASLPQTSGQDSACGPQKLFTHKLANSHMFTLTTTGRWIMWALWNTSRDHPLVASWIMVINHADT